MRAQEVAHRAALKTLVTSFYVKQAELVFEIKRITGAATRRYVLQTTIGEPDGERAPMLTRYY